MALIGLLTELQVVWEYRAFGRVTGFFSGRVCGIDWAFGSVTGSLGVSAIDRAFGRVTGFFLGECVALIGLLAEL